MSTDPLEGQVIGGKYRLQEQIARGGMGAIYRATQEPLGRVVALKVLAPKSADGVARPVDRKRFFREASICSQLSHPHVVVIHDYGEMDDGGYFLVMEYLRGRTLGEMIQAYGALPVDQTMHIVRQIASAVTEAHEHGVVHRDLKPDNVILLKRAGDPDYVKVVDFGLVKAVDREVDETVTEKGIVIGSPLYMPPEQIFAGDVDARSDIYALGVVIYEMLTGRPPFVRPHGATGLQDIIRGHAALPPPPFREANPDVAVSPAIEAVVRRCLAKKQDERWPSMAAMMEAFEQALPRESGRTGGVTTTQAAAVPPPVGDVETAELSTAAMMHASTEEEALPFAGQRPVKSVDPVDTQPDQTEPMTSEKALELADAQPRQAVAVPEGEGRKRSAVLWFAAAVLLIGGGVAAFFGLGLGPGGEDPADGAQAAAVEPLEEVEAPPKLARVEPDAAAVADAATPQEPELPAELELRIESGPVEGTVHRDTADGPVACQRTPCTLLVPRARLPRTFVVTAEGYEPYEVVQGETTQLTHRARATLEPVAAADERPSHEALHVLPEADQPEAAAPETKARARPKKPKKPKKGDGETDIKMRR